MTTAAEQLAHDLEPAQGSGSALPKFASMRRGYSVLIARSQFDPDFAERRKLSAQVRVGFVNLTDEEELEAARDAVAKGASDTRAFLARAALKVFDGKPIDQTTFGADVIWAECGSKARNLMTSAFMRGWAADPEEAAASLATFQADSFAL